MAASALVDAGFLVALLSRRDDNHGWAAEQASRFPPPWMTCEAVLSETFRNREHRIIASSRHSHFRLSVCRRSRRRAQTVREIFAGADELRRCLSCTDDRSRERSHVVNHGFRLPYLSAARSADHSMRAPALKPAQCLERVRRRGRVRRRERWRTRRATSEAAKAQAVRSGHDLFFAKRTQFPGGERCGASAWRFVDIDFRRRERPRSEGAS